MMQLIWADPAARIYLSEWGKFWGIQIPALQYQTKRIPNGKIDKNL